MSSKLNETEECISDLEDRIMEIIQSAQQTERRMKKNESNIWDVWDNIKCTNICLLRVAEGEERKKGITNVFEEFIAETSQT